MAVYPFEICHIVYIEFLNKILACRLTNIEFINQTDMKNQRNTEKIPMKDQLISFLDDINYRYRINQDDDERVVIETGVQLKDGNACVYAVYMEKLNLVQFFAVAPIKVPENRRAEVAKFLDYIDSITYIGNLQLNHMDGDLRCKTYFLASENTMDQRVISDNFYESLSQLERHLPIILKISFGGLNADSAKSELIGSINPSDN